MKGEGKKSENMHLKFVSVSKMLEDAKGCIEEGVLEMKLSVRSLKH